MASRSISVYLLKEHSTVETALKKSPYVVKTATPNSALPAADMQVYVRKGDPRPPWWQEYLGITELLAQQTSAAAAFIPVKQRMMVLTFGAGQHFLQEDSYAHDFGTRVVLNAVDPKKLKSADTLDPGSSQRRRTQIPFDGDLALLSFAGDSSVLKSLTGRAKEQFGGLVRSVTGASHLRVSTPAKSSELVSLLETLLDLYESDAYLATFPDIAQISPVTDPSIIGPLNEQLAASVFDRQAQIVLTVPDILDYSDEAFVQFRGRGQSEIFEDVYIKHYREYLEKYGVSPEKFRVDDLKHDRLVLLDGNQDFKRGWSIFRSLIFEAKEQEGFAYHFSDGAWFKIATGLIESLKSYIDPFWGESNLPPHTWSSEGEYNEAVSKLEGAICLDKTNISPNKQTQVEPCDLLRVTGDKVEFIHVKIGTSSSTLSHLFNQAANSAQLLSSDPSAVDKLIALVDKRAGTSKAETVKKALAAGSYSVSIAIVSHKQTIDKKSDNLPFFSRISLRRALKTLVAMRVSATVQLVNDATDQAGKEKKRKARGPK